MLRLPGYELELPRTDASGRWTMDVATPHPKEREELLQAIGDYTLILQDKEMLLTGCLFGKEGDEQAEMVTSLTFARDPHWDAEIATPQPQACHAAVEGFAVAHELLTPPQRPKPGFRVVLGLEPGYGDDINGAFPVSYAKDLLSAGSEVSLRPGYFFARRYGDREMDWQEPAVEVSGSRLKSLHEVAKAAKALRQRRFVVETAAHTTVYNLIEEQV